MPDPNVIFLAFGDSTTDGPGSRDYPDFLTERLGVDPTVVGKQGRGGETTAAGLERFRSYIELELFPNGEVLIYWQGGADLIDFVGETDPLLLTSPLDEGYPFTASLNMLLDQTQANIEALIREAQTEGFAVIVATYYLAPEAPLPCDPLLLDVMIPAQARRANAYFSLLNDRIRLAAENTGAVLIDVENDADGLTAEHFHDCTHLNGAGNAVVAELFAEKIRELTTDASAP